MLAIDNASCKFMVAKPQVAQSGAQTNSNFDALFTEAERRRPSDFTVENRSRDDNRGRERTDESRRNEYSARRSENTHEDDTSCAGVAVIYEPVQNTVYETGTSCESSGESVVNEEEVIAKIAEIMQVPVEVVTGILQELGLKAQDLTDKQAVVKMLQVALDAESVATLLTDSKFSEIYNALTKLMKTEIQLNKETVNVIAEELEVEVGNDGEVIVGERATNEKESGSLRQNAATQTDTPQVEQMAEIADAKLFAPDEAISNENQAVNPALLMEVNEAKATQSTQQTAVPQPHVNTADVIEQIVNQVKLASGGGQFNEIRMTLRPESLGDIVLRVITQNGIVMAQFEAESQRVKEALEADFNSLRNALTESGIKFSELSVSVRQDGNERMNQFERARQASRVRAESVETVEEPEIISYHNGVIDVTA